MLGRKVLPFRRSRLGLTALAAAGLGALTVPAHAGAAAGAAYSGFNGLLRRAPYVTDVTQSSAYVNWATTSSIPGSVKISPMSGGTCPSSTTQWSSSAIKAPTALPGPVNPVKSAGSATQTGWAFSVTNGAGAVAHEYQASVRVNGLSAGTSYCYAVFSTDTSSAVNLLPSSRPYQSFSSLKAVGSGASVTFDVMGDTGENYQSTGGTVTPYANGINPYQAALDEEIGSSGAQFLLLAGDVAYAGGTASNYGDLVATGGQPEVSTIFGPNYWPQTGGLPTFAADGNHGQNVTTLRTWPTHDTAAASGGTYALDSYSGIDGISGNFPDDWYAFSTSNVRIYVLDASWTDSTVGTASGSLCGSNASHCKSYQADYDEHWQQTSPEYKWLKADLAAHPGGIKFAVMHYPLRSDSATEPSDPYLQNSTTNPHAATSLESLLTANHVAMAFNGHAHTYQRWAPKASGQIINYVTGGGGGVLEPVLGSTTCKNALQTADIYAIGWSASSGKRSYCGPADTSGAAAVASATPQSPGAVYHFLKVTVSGSTVTVSPTSANGNIFDQKTYKF